MEATNFSLRAYFERIGYRGAPQPDRETLTAIMRRQLRAVPFENLDVQAGKVVSLVPEEIVDKIIGNGRGGYCYEVNGLFAMAVQALGMAYRFVAARPRTYASRRPRTHMALILTFEGERWLFDLGFGSHGIRAPMSLDCPDTDVLQDFDTYRLEKIGAERYLLRTVVEGQWADQYEFDLSAQEWVDFVPANFLNSKHPDSLFVQHLVAVRQTDEGRKILFDNTFKVIARGQTASRIVAAHERDAVLQHEFGLVAPR